MDAIEYFKGMRKRLCEDYLKFLPKKSVGYQATLKEMSFYDAAIKALEQEPVYYPPCIDCNKKMDEIRHAYDKLKEQEPCDKYIKEIDHLRKYIYKLETQIVEQRPCEDAISRSEAIRIASGYCHWSNIPDELEKLPSVNPKPCEDAISRQAAIDAIEKNAYRHTYLDQIIDIVSELPPVTPAQKMGRWIVTDDDAFVYCSECEDSYYSRPIDASWYYCPHCGAKMEGVEE